MGSMKLVLRSDVEHLGRLGDIVTVKPGYGRNYLIPQGLAMRASESNLKAFELERRKLQEKVDALRGTATAMAERLNGLEVRIPVRVGEGDKLYGSVTTQVIAEALAAMGIEFDRKKIDLGQPIKALGDWDVPVKLHPDVHAALLVRVVRQDFGQADEQQPEEQQSVEETQE